MLQSYWLDCGMSTIYAFPYRRSGPFILRRLITVETWVFGKIGNTLSAEDREMLHMFVKS